MKRIITFALALVMALGVVGTANAIDVKVKGTWQFAFMWTDGTTSGGQVRHNRGEREDDAFNATQRIRTQIDFIASENLQGVLMFEIGNVDWGRGGTSGRGAGGQLDADGVNIETKRAYLDWMVPGSDLAIRMGIQAINLPMANGYTNPVFSADVAGIVANYQFTDMFALTAFWARPFDVSWRDDSSTARHDEMDMFGLMAPITGEGWTVTPWVMYSNIGNASGLVEYLYGYMGRNPDLPFSAVQADRANAWWGGLSTEIAIFDPLTFGFDVMYGKMDQLDVGLDVFGTGVTIPYETSGWFITGALNYAMDWGTPGLFAWWSSGDDYDDVTEDGKFGRIPVVGVDDGFGATSFGLPGANSPIGDCALGVTPMGTWAVGVQIADMSFVQDLTHTLRFVYYRGTNDKEFAKVLGDGIKMSGEAVYLTTKDAAYEVNFDHAYQIYDNLTTFLELGYIHLDLKEYDSALMDRGSSNAWKAQVVFKYSF